MYGQRSSEKETGMKREEGRLDLWLRRENKNLNKKNI